MILSWTELGLASNLVRHLRAVNRVTRTEIDGHVFAYPDLKEAWVSEDGFHILLTHRHDHTWQHWVNVPDEGWRFIAVYATEQQAEDAVLDYVASCAIDPGTYVRARLTPTSRPIRVHCTSGEGPEVLNGIFRRLGYETIVDIVA